MSALGQKQTCALQNLMSALPPIATAKADMPQLVMSALSPKADMCGATGDVRFWDRFRVVRMIEWNKGVAAAFA